jgi:putative transposase
MPQSAGPTPVRLEIRAGEIAVCGSRLVRIKEVAIDGKVEVEDLASGEHREVTLADLSSRQSGAIGVALDTQAEVGRDASDAVWQSAAGREAALTDLLNDRGPLAQRAALTASQQKVCVRTVYRWLARYRDTSQTSALIAHRRGVRVGTRRLDGERERLVTKIIEQEYLSQSRPSAEEIVRIVHQRCIEGKWKPVSRNAIRARINQLDPRTRTRTRLGAKAARLEHTPTPGHFHVERPLDSVQIDHALADVIVVDERDRESIGRPWLTMAIDVFTRIVLGFYVTLEPPSVTSIGLCVSQACLPKDPWLAARNLGNIEWPLCGLPKVLRADNGRDFRSAPLRRGCQEHKIQLEFRPMATPHFGGHIERLIGSVMGRIHLLPGTTFSNPRERKGYPSEEKAAMTLVEFERWLAVEIAERYHRHFHRGIGATPLGMWEHFMKGGCKFEIPGDARRFRIAFLPMEERKLQRTGLQLFNLRYWSDALPTFVRHDEPLTIRYDPRDMSKIFVKAPDQSYAEIPYADMRCPPISLWEIRAARRHLAKQGNTQVNQMALFRAHDELKRLVAESVSTTQSVRRDRARRENLERERKLENSAPLPPASTVDYSREARELPVELGEPRSRR